MRSPGARRVWTPRVRTRAVAVLAACALFAALAVLAALSTSGCADVSIEVISASDHDASPMDGGPYPAWDTSGTEDGPIPGPLYDQAVDAPSDELGGGLDLWGMDGFIIFDGLVAD